MQQSEASSALQVRSFSNSESFVVVVVVFEMLIVHTFLRNECESFTATKNQYLSMCDAIMVELSMLPWCKQGSVMLLLDCVFHVCVLADFVCSFFLNLFFIFLGESLRRLWVDHSSAIWLSGIEAQQRDSVV